MLNISLEIYICFNILCLETDKRKERKRNFSSVKAGFITSIATIVSYIFFSVVYGFKVNSILH